MANAQLIHTISSLSNDTTLSEHDRNWLVNRENQTKLADLIEKRCSRQEFLELHGMSEGLYTEIRIKLNKKPVDANTTIVANSGRRGGLGVIGLQQPPAPAPGNAQQEAEIRQGAEKLKESELKLEKSYYPLVEAWAKSNGYPDCTITGPGIPGYKWENADLIALSYYVSKLTRSLRFEVTAFEVKLRVEPHAVWQAAHYRRFSTEAYVAFAMSDEEVRAAQDGRVFELAIQLGLGVLAFDGQNSSFKLLQSARVQAPNEVDVDEIVQNYRASFDVLITKARRDHAECFAFRPAD